MAVRLLFFLSGAAIGTWTARIPAIKERLGLGDGLLSLALLAVAAGAVIGMAAVGRLVDRYGSGRAVVPAALAQGVALVPPAYARAGVGAGAGVGCRVQRAAHAASTTISAPTVQNVAAAVSSRCANSSPAAAPANPPRL